MQPIEGAFYCIDKGWKVFPVNRNKVPTVKHWQQWATTDKTKVQEYYEANPDTLWAVFAGGSGLAVIDLDNKPDKPGKQAWLALADQHKETATTFVVKTPSGGYHLYYSGEIQNSVSTLAPGVDTRGTGGYVLAPGGEYTVVKDLPLAPLPHWVPALLRSRPPLSRPDDHEVEASIPEGNRNGELTRWAGVLRANGLTKDEMLAAMLQINVTRCDPPLPENEIETIVASIATKERGVASAIADFSVEQDGAEGLQLDLHNAKDWLSQCPKAVHPILENIFDIGDKAVLIGSSKQRKSWAALQIAFSVAAGKDVFGFRTPEPRKVAYLNFEIQSHHFHRRLLKVAKGLMVNEQDIGDRLRFFNLRGTGASITDIRLALQDWGPELIVCDPLYKCYGSGHDENASGDTARLLAEFDRLANGGAAVLTVHHDKKGASGDSKAVDRGSGSGVLARDYDACFVMTAHAEEDGVAVMSMVVRNYAPIEDFCLRWDDEKCFVLDEDSDALPETSHTRRCKAMRGPKASDMALAALEWLREDERAQKQSFNTEIKARLIEEFGVGEKKAQAVIRELKTAHGCEQLRDKSTQQYFVTCVKSC